MLLKGMRVDSKINSLDDIFNHDDLGLLADVKPIAAKPMPMRWFYKHSASRIVFQTAWTFTE